MRIPDNNYHKLARVQFIYADSLDILNNLNITDKSAYLHYEESATDILIKPNILLKNYLFNNWCDNLNLTIKFKSLQKNRRAKLIQTHNKFSQQESMNKVELEEMFTEHFGYEQLAIDKYLSEELFLEELIQSMPEKEAQNVFGSVLTPFDGKTFFEESNIIRLKHLANIINPDNELTRTYDWNWYRERSLTRHRIYDILENYSSIVNKVKDEINIIKNVFNIKKYDDTIEAIKKIRYKQTLRRKITSEAYASAAKISSRISNYLEIMKLGLPYNEDVRLQRSRSFDIFSKQAIQNGFNPKVLYREFQIKRQKKFIMQYRPEKFTEIMNEDLIRHIGVQK